MNEATRDFRTHPTGGRGVNEQSEPLQRDAWEYAKTDGLPKEAAIFIRKLCLRIGELRSERQNESVFKRQWKEIKALLFPDELNYEPDLAIAVKALLETKATRPASPALDRLKEEIEGAPHTRGCLVTLNPHDSPDCDCFKSRALRIIEELKQ